MKSFCLLFVSLLVLNIGLIKAENDQSSPLEPLRRLIVGQVSRLQRLAPQVNQPSQAINEQSERSMYSSSRIMDSINKGIANGYKKFKGAGSWN